jgi:multidrug efflux system membrane fusion protein
VKQAIVVPVSAIRHGPQGEYVYVIADDNTAHVREVKTGVTLDDRTAVTSGLNVGERVVTEGGDRLADGSTVRLPGQQRPDGAPAGDGRKWKGGQPGGEQNAQGQRRHQGGAQPASGQAAQDAG